MTTFQSRWGFHPCTYEMYLKLKRLNFLTFISLRRAGEYKRWERKLPENRRIFVGGKNGWEANNQKKRDIPKMHRVYKPWPTPILAPVDPNTLQWAVYDFHAARTPVVESQVKPLHFTEEQIDSILAKMEAWYANVPEEVIK